MPSPEHRPEQSDETGREGRIEPQTLGVTQDRAKHGPDQRANDPHAVEQGASDQERPAVWPAGRASPGRHGVALVDRQLGEQGSEQPSTRE